MHGDESTERTELRWAARAGYDDRGSGQRQRSRRSERQNHVRMHELEFFHEPPSIPLHFRDGGLLMDAALAALLVFEVLDGVGDVGLLPLDSGRL